ncbi:S8 family serine peptidase [Pseudokineococcus sp. 1T1Z-3]|uniref:S8 family serine peptidase n=1 Tax=Pseudokineococcus sp. 1T1Z-3 TaxID=3132745 RepID=UPI0030B7B839
MTRSPRALPLTAAVAVLALPLAALPTSALPASALPASAGAVPDVADVLPAEVVEDLSAGQARQVEAALVAPGAGAVVSVAVEAPGGRLVVDALDVRTDRAAGVARLLDGVDAVEVADVAEVVRAVGTAGAAADPYRSLQWPLDTLHAEELRPLVTSTPVVAVLDTGVDGDHPDLDDVLVPGVDVVDGTTGPRAGWVDPQGHGTHVAGIVAAEVGNGTGVEGLLAGARVMPVRVLGADGSGSTAQVAQGVVAAVDAGASVLNLSLGASRSDEVLRRAVAYAGERGVVVVAAMGNDGAKGSPTSYPAAYDGVVAVAATDRADARASFSSSGPHADLAAPGAEVASTWTGAGYRYASGTSMASPYAAAAAAAVRGAAPGLTPTQVEEVLEQTALDLGAPGHDDLYGWGRLVPVAAVERARQLTAPPTGPAPEDPEPEDPAPEDPAPEDPAPEDPAPEQPVLLAPGTPTSLSAVAGEQSAEVRWQPPAPAETAAEVTGYEVRLVAPGRAETVVATDAAARSTTLRGLLAGTTYRVEVRALSAAGVGEAATTQVRPVAPATSPRSLRAVPGPGRAAVSWQAPASVGTGATGYEVRVSARGREDVVVRTSAAARATTVAGLADGVDHAVAVRVLTASGAGPWATTSVRPRTTASAPQRVTVSSGSTRDRATGVVVAWSAPASDGGSAVTSYRVLLRAQGTSRDVVVTVRPTVSSGRGSSQSVAVGGLRRGTSYSAVVLAVTDAGPGAASARSGSAVAR